MIREVLRMERVTYKEQGQICLDNFNITVQRGEIFGLVPVNYYGIDALFKLLVHNLPLHYGYVYYQERLVNQWQHPRESSNRISIIQNKSSLANDLRVTDNVFVLRKGFQKRILFSSLLRKQLQPFLDEIGINIPADRYVSELSAFEKFVVELLKAIVAGNHLIVLEDIGSFISESELERLHGIIRYYAEKGFSFLYIVPHFGEANQLCDRMALMVNGKIIKCFRTGDTIPVTFPVRSVEDYDNWVRTQLTLRQKEREMQAVLTMEGVCYDKLRGFNLRIAPGECVVLQDLDNAIVSDFIDLFQGEKPERGTFILEGGKQLRKRNRDLAVIQELPTETMIYEGLSYFDNLCMNMDHRVNGVWYQRGIRKSIKHEYKDLLGEDVFDSNVKYLSAKQKYDLVYTRIYLQQPKVVLCIQPFKNAEVSLRSHIWELLERFLSRKIAVIIMAVNLADSLALADRLIRIKHGSVQEVYDKEDFLKLPIHTPWLHLYQERYAMDMPEE